MRILVSADDFGLSHECNLGVDYCIRNGFAETAQIVVNTQHTQEAIDLAQKGGYMDKVGLHINLVSGQSLSTPITSVRDYYDKSNNHFKDISKWSYKKVFGNKFVSELREEIDAQMKLFLTFFSPGMLSTHHDVMFHRPIMKAIKPLLNQYGFLITRGVEPYLFDLSGRYSRLVGLRYYPFKFYYRNCFKLKNINNCKVLQGGRHITHFIMDYNLVETDNPGKMKRDGCYELIIHPYCNGNQYYDKTNFSKQGGKLSDTIDLISGIEKVSLNELMTKNLF